MLETYYGCVRTPVDAIKLFEACRIGLLPRVQRRLSEKERQAIRSGSVFVWDEREAGMRRWTDGKSWSASRVSGSFLTYREMEGKRGNAFGGPRRHAGKTPDSGRGSDEDHDDGEPDGYRYKADGLMKQSFSITTSAGEHLHLISYYARGQHNLPQPSTDPHLKNITPPKGMYPESSLNETPVPAMTRTPMQQQPYPPHHHQGPPHPGYHHQYPPAGYAWPPSPIATPPYSHAHYQYPQGHGPPPPSHAYPPHPHHQYQPGPPNPAYERAPLPLPHPQLSAPLPAKPVMSLPQPHLPRTHHYASPPAPDHRSPPLDSPRSQHLQAQAREAVMIDPRAAAGTERSSPPGLLPMPGSQPPHHHHQQHQQQHHYQPQQQQPQQNEAYPSALPTSPHPPAPRALSASPPRSASSDVKSERAAMPLSRMLLHPDPSSNFSSSTTNSSSSEPNSATSPHPNANPISSNTSGGNSPGGSQSSHAPQPVDALPAGQQTQGIAAGVDAARAIGVLNKNFCI
ncbi:cAMP-independent regulatory protein pac2 [Madurella mycetomatis]|uniref:cAMP-independent regulatory protein pac2 n=1 Tax=Madurella mycetomatis TaxID=100816 RepID=A0A175WB74_9PEZI|nr:cAMP-independent regulatory protein pac2 [Madurella mycetomatis]